MLVWVLLTAEVLRTVAVLRTVGQPWRRKSLVACERLRPRAVGLEEDVAVLAGLLATLADVQPSRSERVAWAWAAAAPRAHSGRHRMAVPHRSRSAPPMEAGEGEQLHAKLLKLSLPMSLLEVAMEVRRPALVLRRRREWALLQVSWQEAEVAAAPSAAGRY